MKSFALACLALSAAATCPWCNCNGTTEKKLFIINPDSLGGISWANEVLAKP